MNEADEGALLVSERHATSGRWGIEDDGNAASSLAIELRALLRANADPAIAASTQRFFPTPIDALGVSNEAVRKLADVFLSEHAALTPDLRLEIAERLIAGAGPHEEVLLGFSLIRKAVKRSFDARLLDRCRLWLERNVSNWAQCDDLCLQVLYPFFLTRVELLPAIESWAHSRAPWVRRAANVALVKFVHRRIGRTTYELPLEVVFLNALTLIDDPDPYVQKSIGWLLKAAADHQPTEVITFLETHIARWDRGTLRYAIEKLPPAERKALLTRGASSTAATVRVSRGR